MSFVVKKMHLSGSLGDDLRELRESAGLTLEQASTKTKVIPSMIVTWERGDWASFGTEAVYLERMLMGYVRAFGGRETFFLNKFRSELKLLRLKPVQAQIREMRPFRGMDFFWTAKMRVALFLVLFVSGLGFYVVAQARSLAEPPPIEVFSPVEGAVLHEPVIHVKGKTVPGATVFVNEQPAMLHQDGTFDLDLEIPRGSNEVQVRVKKRHSHDVVITRHAIYERSSDALQEL